MFFAILLSFFLAADFVSFKNYDTRAAAAWILAASICEGFIELLLISR